MIREEQHALQSNATELGVVLVWELEGYDHDLARPTFSHSCATSLHMRSPFAVTSVSSACSYSQQAQNLYWK